MTVVSGRLVLALAAAALAACGPAASTATGRESATVKRLCSKCHDPPKMGSIAPGRWSEMRGVHRGRVKLSDDEWLSMEELLTRPR
jgi:cytochrome c553